MNKKIISFTLLGLILGSAAQTNCADKTSEKECCMISAVTQKLGKPATILIASVLGLTIYRLYSKRAEQDPKSRFETAKLTDAVKTMNFKEVSSQLWYFIDDILIGQLYKKDGVKANKEGNLEVSKGTPSTGLLGNLQGKIFPISMALFFASELKKFMQSAKDSAAVIGLCQN